MDRLKKLLVIIVTISILSGYLESTQLISYGKEKTASTSSKSVKKVSASNESKWYRKSIPLKKEYQKLLWELSQKRGLNYVDMLCIISLESGYNEKCSCGKNKGLFQISTGYAAYYAKKLKIANKPLDGKININMGTAMFADIYKDKRVRYKKASRKLEVVLSIFNKGTGGYDKYGLAKRFLRVFYAKKAKIKKYF